MRSFIRRSVVLLHDQAVDAGVAVAKWLRHWRPKNSDQPLPALAAMRIADALWGIV